MQCLIYAAILFCPPPCNSAGPEAVLTYSTPRFTLHVGATKQSSLGKNPYVETAVDDSLEVLNTTFEELKRVFDTIPRNRVTLRFLTPDEFRDATGAPSWTSAMYFGGEITVPVASNEALNKHHLKRALRHEYVHAVIAELSENRCPAWLDEGLAQLIEGEPNPLLGPALRKWAQHNDPLPLAHLQDGFTLLDDSLVPTAYAESLFATRTLINRRGFAAVRNYLKNLRELKTPEEAFELSFGEKQSKFEKGLATQIKRWASSGNQHP